MQYDDFQIETFLRTGENEPELRETFGDVLYDELAHLAKSIDQTPDLLESHRRKVFILPGIMGSRLSAIEDGQTDLVWIQPSDLASGGIEKIRWGASVAATGTVLAPYLRLKLRLKLAGYDAEFMPYDWRQSPLVTGTALMRQIKKRGLRDITLVCHSMGGLVARQMAAEDTEESVISKVVTIGTPNKGSYAPVQVFDLSHSMLGPLGLVDLKHDREALVKKYLRAFPGLIEMMPAPSARRGENYFTRASWPSSAVPPTPTNLKQAKAAAAALPAPDARFHQIIGTGEETVVGARKEGDAHAFSLSHDGDGTVPRDLAEMGDIPRYYCQGAHGWLCNKGAVIKATLDLIGSGQTNALPKSVQMNANEALAFEALSSELAAANEATSAPQHEVEFAGAFLSQRMDDGAVGTNRNVETSAPAQTAYSNSVVQAACERWQASDDERQSVLESHLEARPLQAETTERLHAYTRRLISQVDAASGNGQARKISSELSSALRRLDEVALETSPPTSALLERVIGEAEEFLSVMFVKRAVVAARAVGRVVSKSNGRGFGTGFLIAPGILITNHHVLGDAFSAERASVQFRYELEIDSREMPGHTFELEPHRLFYADERLDMAIVAVAPIALDGTQLSEFGVLPLIGVEGKIRKGQPVNIIQHPLAGRKQVVFRESVLSALPTDSDHVAHYTGDTQPGSSGAPVFSDRWEVVALHHSGVPEQNIDGSYMTVDGGVWNPNADPEMRTVKWIANEGIRISRIVAHLNSLPERLNRDGLPGSVLVEELLTVSRQAARDGIFTQPWANPTPLEGHTPSASSPQVWSGHNEASLTIPLQINFEIGTSQPFPSKAPAGG